MSRALLYLAIAFLLYQIGKSLYRRYTGSAPADRARTRGRREQPAVHEGRKGVEIDYSKIRDAEYRDVRGKE